MSKWKITRDKKKNVEATDMEFYALKKKINKKEETKGWALVLTIVLYSHCTALAFQCFYNWNNVLQFFVCLFHTFTLIVFT